MNKRVMLMGLGLTVFIGVVMVIIVLIPKDNTLRGTVYDPALPAPEFELTQGNGSSFRLSETRGQIVLLYFGYTFCPDVCPTTLSDLRRVKADLGDDAPQVQVLFVTVDPERDTFEKLGKYVSQFDPTFIGLSGSMDELAKVWDAYGIYREETEFPNSASGYLVNHTARVFLIDQDGNLHLSYSYGTPPEDILHDIRILLR